MHGSGIVCSHLWCLILTIYGQKQHMCTIWHVFHILHRVLCICEQCGVVCVCVSVCPHKRYVYITFSCFYQHTQNPGVCEKLKKKSSLN